MIYTIGSNDHGQLGINDASITFKNSPILIEALLDKKPIDISCGASHTVTCTEDGDVYSWGEGRFGALGVSSEVD